MGTYLHKIVFEKLWLAKHWSKFMCFRKVYYVGYMDTVLFWTSKRI